MKTKQPKFKVGDKVSHKSDLYGMTESTVTEMIRRFKEVDSSGNFVVNGSSTLEDTIKSICIPYDFDGETLTVHYPKNEWNLAYSRSSKFSGYSYVTENKKINTIWPERSLKPRK